ncbi:MAG: stage III sporulation protein AB [Oscillospiraceae bacterium]|nr:stage III sporulation protein AB [Oscillospiraceae bacterium]
MLLLFLACSSAGFLAAAKLRRQAAQMQLLTALLCDFMTYIRYQCLPLEELLNLFAAHPHYRSFRFLHRTAEGFSAAVPPSLLWQEAVAEDAAVPPQAQAILHALGTMLGTTDAEGQLASLEMYRMQMQTAADEMKEQSHKKGTLYCQLGVLAGAMLALLVL